jgi:predicted nucleic acid-binding protein
VTPVVIDASAGVAIVTDTTRGRRLTQLLPADAVGWVPQHFYVEVAGVIRHRTVVTGALPEAAALTALNRLERWHLRQALVHPLLTPACSTGTT